MVFICLFFFYLIFFTISNLFNINLFFLNITEIYYSNFLVLIWIFIILFLSFYNRNISSWTTDIILYIFGIYRLIILNFTDALFLIIKNVNILFNFLYYNLKNISGFFNIQIWTPLYKRGGYLFLLNSSRTRWQLSKANSVFKNK